VNPGFPHFAWVIPYSLLVLVLGIVYLRFLMDLPPGTRRRFLIAAMPYLAPALGMEMIGGAYCQRICSITDVPYEIMTGEALRPEIRH
jgi:hypothetical protein